MKELKTCFAGLLLANGLFVGLMGVGVLGQSATAR